MAGDLEPDTHDARGQNEARSVLPEPGREQGAQHHGSDGSAGWGGCRQG
jgi:hypothetical protein